MICAAEIQRTRLIYTSSLKSRGRSKVRKLKNLESSKIKSVHGSRTHRLIGDVVVKRNQKIEFKVCAAEITILNARTDRGKLPCPFTSDACLRVNQFPTWRKYA